LLAAAVVIGLGITTFGRVAARSGPAIFVDNYNYVTAYPIGSAGNAAPIAVTPDMRRCPELSSNLGWRSDAWMLSGLLLISNLIFI
jgi:hypothetical protein